MTRRSGTSTSRPARSNRPSTARRLRSPSWVRRPGAFRQPQWAKRVAAVVEALPQSDEPGAPGSQEPKAPPLFAAMLTALGVAMVQAGQATNDVDSTLTRIAAAYSAPATRVVILPTVILVYVGGEETTTTEIDSVSGRSLRLDQAGRTARLVNRALEAELAPSEVLEEVRRIRATPPRFSPALVVCGHVLLTLGFGLTLNPVPSALPAYVILGAVVGLLIVVSRRLPTVSSILPVVAAFVVTALTGLLLSGSVVEDPLRVLTPPLVTFLPGLLMTIAAIELTSNQIIAGASRIVYGLAQLALLAFGVFAALTLVNDLAPSNDATPDFLGWWSRWVGVFLTAAGYVLFSSAPRGSFKWILLCAFGAVGAQTLGRELLSPELSGFVGALVVVPLTTFLTRFKSAPPSVVTQQPSLWLLVPGAIGFIGFGSVATQTPGAGELLVSTAVSLVSIAIGMLVGTGLSRDLIVAREAWTRPVTDGKSESGGTGQSAG